MSNDQTTTILDKSNRNKSIHHNRSATDRIFNRANNYMLDQSIEVPNKSIEVFKNHNIRPKSANKQIEMLKNHHLHSKDQLEQIQYLRVSNQKGAHRKLKSYPSKPKIKTESVN